MFKVFKIFLVCILSFISNSLAEQLNWTYPELNPRVVVSQNNGGSFAVGTSFTGAKTWSVIWPDQLIAITSGMYGQYSTLAINEVSTERYGQIMITLGKDLDMWVRLAVFGQMNPQFTSQEGSCGAGPDIILCPTRDLKYRSNSSLVVSRVYPSVTTLYNITINYDLVLDTYEIWLNSGKIAGPVAFDSSLETINSIAIGGTYRSSNIAVLGYWHWMTSDTIPFISAGVVNTSSVCPDVWASGEGLTADLNQDCYVTFADFVQFAAEWLNCNNPSDVDCQ
ncbi:MAG: hypothetical protein A2Y12_17305 [Planctomycetes bacterium GWF2_42_9]|nr:MAG: hypothetical protein A2Y12_17305 [Planctomycetes bacterium GWF2_42_9]